jgi:hypothetical protein
MNNRICNTVYFDNDNDANLYVKNDESHPNVKYDFIIVTHHKSDEKKNRILKKINEWHDNCFEVSNVKFFLTEALIIDNVDETKEPDEPVIQIIKLDFKTDAYNYYLVNNVFDEQFIKYLLIIYHNCELKHLNSQTIRVRLLDQNFKQIEYDIKNDYIHISKTNYFRKTDIITEEE